MGRRLSHEEYLLRVNENNPSIKVLGTYINSTTKILHRCLCGREWNTTPKEIMSGKAKSCGKCHEISNKEYIQKVREKNPSIQVLGTYVNLVTKLLHRCSCGREWNVMPHSILSGNSKCCGKCNELNNEEYVLKVKNINPFIEVLGTYINSKTPILHRCSCGKEWEVIPFSILSGNTKSCGKCNKSMVDIVVGEKYGEWTVINTDKNNANFKYKVLCQCSCGKKQYKYASDLLNSNNPKCRKCSNAENALNRTFSHEGYIQKLKEIGSIVKVKNGNIYEKSDNKLMHICPVCGEDWNVSPNSVLSGQTMCKKCASEVNESFMATILKQVLKYNYTKTEWEYDLGFKGDRGRPSRYDIYVPELNLVIECQSLYHDNKKQKSLDDRKKQYALSKGYLYMDIDHRKVTPLEAIQIFFPDIKEIPAYINVTKRTVRKWSLALAQELLNEGLIYKDIATAVGASYGTLGNCIRNGKLVKPNGYKTQNERRWSLDEAQNLLNQKKYSYVQIANFLGNSCNAQMIANAVKNGVLVRPKYRTKRRKKEPKFIFQLSLDGELINKYERLSNINGFTRHHVTNACKGKNGSKGHEYKGYKWYYEDDLNTGS